MIKIENVSKTYENGTKALNNISLEIAEGEFVAVLGLSGAGKSTLLRTINQIISCTEGNIIFKNVDVNTFELYGDHPEHFIQKKKEQNPDFDESQLVLKDIDITKVKGKKLRKMRSNIGIFRISILSRECLFFKTYYQEGFHTILLGER